MKKDNSVYIDDAIDSVSKILEYTQSMTQERHLAEDQRTLDAVLRRLQVLGESVKRLDNNFRALYPQIPWKEMAGLRDIVIHDYDEIKIERIWLVIKEKLPSVLIQLREITQS